VPFAFLRRSWRKSSSATVDAAWWRDADAIAAQPDAATIEALARAVPDASDASDEAERQHEMIEGLRQLAEVAAQTELPAIATQHRVIGDDVCYWVAPVSLPGETGAAAKLFVTSARLVLSAGRVRAWPWHRVSRLVRQGRDLIAVVAGVPDPLHVQCNTYGDALVVAHLAARAAPPRTASGDRA
jgi:hypothetical protein